MLTRVVIYLALIIAFCGGLMYSGYNLGYDHATLKMAEEERNATAKRLSDNAKLAANQEKDRAAQQKGYEDEITNLHNRIAQSDRLRVACSRPATKTESATSGSSNGADTGTRLVSPRTQQDFDELELRVESVFASCRVAQEFIRTQ